MEGRPKRANPNSFHKLCRPYVLIAIQHPSIEDGCGIYSQPALLICLGAIPLLFESTRSRCSSPPPRCGTNPSCFQFQLPETGPGVAARALLAFWASYSVQKNGKSGPRLSEKHVARFAAANNILTAHGHGAGRSCGLAPLPLPRPRTADPQLQCNSGTRMSCLFASCVIIMISNGLVCRNPGSWKSDIRWGTRGHAVGFFDVWLTWGLEQTTVPCCHFARLRALKDVSKPDHVYYILDKAIHGLKQILRVWYFSWVINWSVSVSMRQKTDIVLFFYNKYNIPILYLST